MKCFKQQLMANFAASCQPGQKIVQLCVWLWQVQDTQETMTKAWR